MVAYGRQLLSLRTDDLARIFVLNCPSGRALFGEVASDGDGLAVFVWLVSLITLVLDRDRNFGSAGRNVTVCVELGRNTRTIDLL